MAMTEYPADTDVPKYTDEPVRQIGNVKIWLWELDSLGGSWTQIASLSGEERLRAARFKDPNESRRYIASCILTRRILAGVTGIRPDRLEILVDKCGKPFLMSSTIDHSGRKPRFNISHSENLLCIAVGEGCEIGVDIEVVKADTDVLAISNASLDPVSIGIIERCSSEERAFVFYRTWTEREAFAKMQGHRMGSDHLQPMPAGSWREEILDFTVDEKRVLGSLAVRPLAE